MAIVIVGQVFGAAATRDRLVRALLGAQTAARDEEGCLSYVVGSSLEEPTTFVITGHFRDEGALEAHYASPAFAAFQGQLDGLLARTSALEIFEVTAATRPLDSRPLDPRAAD